MTKKLLLLFLLPSYFIWSQSKDLSFENSSSSIKLDLKNVSVLEIPFTLTTNFYPKDLYFSVKLENTNLKEEYKIIRKKIEGSKNKYFFSIKKGMLLDTVGKNLKEKNELLKEFNRKNLYNLLGKPEKLTLSLITDEKDSLSSTKAKKDIYIINKQDNYDSNREYNLFLGANFDLKEQLVSNTFYSEINVFLPNLFNISKKNKILGIAGRIYKNNSVSTSNSFNVDKVSLSYNVTQDSNNSDSITVSKSRVIRKTLESYSNLGINFSLLVSLEKLSGSKFKSYLDISYEIVDRNKTFSSSDKKLYTISEKKYSSEDFENNIPLRNSLFSDQEYSINYHDSFVGIGKIGIYNTRDVQIYYNSKFGFGTYGGASKKNVIHPFGSFNFFLIEKKLGIKLNGEIRKFFNSGQKSYININLSKSINLSSLLGYRKNSL